MRVRESVVSITNIPEGSLITDKMVSVKRPSPVSAIPAKDMSKVQAERLLQRLKVTGKFCGRNSINQVPYFGHNGVACNDQAGQCCESRRISRLRSEDIGYRNALIGVWEYCGHAD